MTISHYMHKCPYYCVQTQLDDLQHHLIQIYDRHNAYKAAHCKCQGTKMTELVHTLTMNTTRLRLQYASTQ